MTLNEALTRPPVDPGFVWFCVAFGALAVWAIVRAIVDRKDDRDPVTKALATRGVIAGEQVASLNSPMAAAPVAVNPQRDAVIQPPAGLDLPPMMRGRKLKVTAFDLRAKAATLLQECGLDGVLSSDSVPAEMKHIVQDLHDQAFLAWQTADDAALKAAKEQRRAERRARKEARASSSKVERREAARALAETSIPEAFRDASAAQASSEQSINSPGD